MPEEDEPTPQEWLDAVEDDATIDALHNITGPSIAADQSDQALLDLVSAIRDSVDNRDIPVPYLAATERGENVLPEQPAEPPPERNTPVSDAQQIGNRLIELGNSTNAMGMIEQAKQDIEAMRDQAVSALGSGHPRVNDVAGPAAAAQEALGTATQMVQALLAALVSTGTSIAGGGS